MFKVSFKEDFIDPLQEIVDPNDPVCEILDGTLSSVIDITAHQLDF